ncbi:MAG: dienelactone hydrolase family protein, partial [Acetobacteraceae bacterium]
MASITIKAGDGSGSFSAYLVEPKSKPAGVVVLIQEIFGVNQAMRDIAAGVADMHFIALCPDLFWRLEPGVDITDKTEADWKKAFDLFGKFDQGKGIEDLKATVAVARKLPGSNGKVATMGYCLGGRLAFMMAEQSDADANISYYGVGLDNLLGDLNRVSKPLVVHIADQDEFFPPEGRAKVVAGAQGHQQITC